MHTEATKLHCHDSSERLVSLSILGEPMGLTIPVHS